MRGNDSNDRLVCKVAPQTAPFGQPKSGVGKRRAVVAHGDSSPSASECCWLWLEVSRWFPWLGGALLRLRAAAHVTAEAVLIALEDADHIFELEVFGGLLPDLLRLCPRIAPGSACSPSVCAEAPTAQHPAPSEEVLGGSAVAAAANAARPLVDTAIGAGLERWLQLLRRFPPSRCSAEEPSGGPVARRLLGAPPPRGREAKGVDITDQLCALPLGTLIWLEGRVVIQNCFNSLTHCRARLSGAWLLRSHAPHFDQERRVLLQRFGEPERVEWLGVHSRFYGECGLPYIAEAEWSYVMDVKPAASSELPYIADLLRPDCRADGGAGDVDFCERIDQVPLPPSLAAAAHHAVSVKEEEEALLLQWRLAGCVAAVPVRLAVYATDLRDDGPLRVYDELRLMSHLFAAEPPASPDVSSLRKA